MNCGAIRWVCTASVVRSEVERFISKLRLNDVPPALRVPQATLASSDEEERRESRESRFRIPQNEAPPLTRTRLTVQLGEGGRVRASRR